MNNTAPEKKENLMKKLAIVGLFGIIIIIAWLSVQIVSVLPNALNSLASLADSVYNFDPNATSTIALRPATGPVITGNEFIISWENPQKKGTYAFSYKCQEGLAIEVQTTESEFLTTQCENSYELGTVDTVKLIVNSEKKPVVDLDYTISYFKTNSASSSAQESQVVTVLNPRFAMSTSSNPVSEETITETATSTEVAITNPDDGFLPTIEQEVAGTTTRPEIVAEVNTPKPEVEETKPVVVATPTKPVTPKPTPVPVYEYTYAIPTSDPNGYVDLAVTYLGIGKVTSKGVFINTGSLNTDEDGAMQFSVKNIGTKTSADWNFTAILPGEINYESQKQTSLKPNERTILTINFPAVTKTKLYTFSLTTKTDNDIKTSNNKASWSVVVIK
jgi:CARDB